MKTLKTIYKTLVVYKAFSQVEAWDHYFLDMDFNITQPNNIKKNFQMFYKNNSIQHKLLAP